MVFRFRTRLCIQNWFHCMSIHRKGLDQEKKKRCKCLIDKRSMLNIWIYIFYIKFEKTLPIIIFSERMASISMPNIVVAFVGHKLYLFASLKLPIITPWHRLLYLHSFFATLSELYSSPLGSQSVLERFLKAYSEIFKNVLT